MTLLL